MASIHLIQASIPFFRCSGVEFFIIFRGRAPKPCTERQIFHRILLVILEIKLIAVAPVDLFFDPPAGLTRGLPGHADGF